MLVGNNIRDEARDRAAGISTVVRYLGNRATRALYIVLVVAGVLGVAAIGVTRFGPMLLLAAPITFLPAIKPLRAIWRNQPPPDIDARTAQFETALLTFVLVAVTVDHLAFAA